MPSGSAYLEGATVTIAGATLLQRVASAVAKFGGNVLSTQLDVQSPSSKPGFLSMIASCEIEQPQLQQLLYDLEAGMPFLFVDQFVIQTPTSSVRLAGRQVADSPGGVGAMAGRQMNRSLVAAASMVSLMSLHARGSGDDQRSRRTRSTPGSPMRRGWADRPIRRPVSR